MSILRTLATLLFVLVIAVPVSAQVCNPPCTGTFSCVYVDGGPTTACEDEGLVVQPDLRSGPSFASIVYGVIVPAVDLALIPLLYAIAFVVFLIGIVRFFFSDSEEKRKSGRQFALWGIIGFAVMFSVWGLVKVLLSLLPMGA